MAISVLNVLQTAVHAMQMDVYHAILVSPIQQILAILRVLTLIAMNVEMMEQLVQCAL